MTRHERFKQRVSLGLSRPRASRAKPEEPRAERKKADKRRRPKPYKSRFEHGVFRAIDGEGHEIDGVPQYVLLMASDGTPANEKYVYNSHGLSTAQCLEFLLSLSDKKHINVMFSNSYDVNMMLRDVDKHTLMQIWDNESYRGVHIPGGYWVKYVPRKSFRVADAERSITIYDVFGYFQSSFISAIEEWLPEFEGLDIIREGKARRGQSLFDTGVAYTVRYTRAELTAMVKLMDLVRGYLKVASIRVQRWDGAGSIATGLLQAHYRKPRVDEVMHHRAYSAYYGGRIEAFGAGTLDQTLWQYDIRSAYPAVMTELPSLDGEWIRTNRVRHDRIGLYKISWQTNDNICPFPVRDRNYRILFPQTGTTWIWHYELQAALEQQSVDITVRDGYYLEPEDEQARPFNWVETLYNQRRIWKQTGVRAEKILKLGINALYGKLAQTVGYNANNDTPPPYHNPLYAGLITSGTRAKMYRAMMQNQHGIAYCATDSLVSNRPLELDIGNGLGQYEDVVLDGIKLVTSGVYCWNVDGAWQYKHRGLDKGLFTVEALDEAWRAGSSYIKTQHTRFVGMGAALASTDFEQVWRRFITTDRCINIAGQNEYKRDIFYEFSGSHDMSREWIANEPLVHSEDSRSYRPLWGNTSARYAQLAVLMNENNILDILEEQEADYG